VAVGGEATLSQRVVAGVGEVVAGVALAGGRVLGVWNKKYYQNNQNNNKYILNQKIPVQ